ncbi:MAG: RusA family crossover junction endodeoxyribonuclease [Lachnospiraceae bacterium]|nr:RusA family crossover junction endodeoxyribonuclease [Lachnospiraceae bacterium]
MITFSVPGPPQGKARARTVRTKKGDSVSFTPARTEYYEYRILNAFLFEAGNPKELVFAKGVPVRIRITAYYKPAARTTKKDMIKIQNGEKFPTRKPDADNIVKAVLDALNGSAYYDDAQVIEITVRKLFSFDEGLTVTVGAASEDWSDPAGMHI